MDPRSEPADQDRVLQSTTPRAPNTRFWPARLGIISDRLAAPNGGSAGDTCLGSLLLSVLPS